MIFFLNSSRILKDFFLNSSRILCKITFEKIYICKINLICNLYALLCWQNFILAKSGCYKPTPLRGISPSRFMK
jgi:hypothetical protein